MRQSAINAGTLVSGDEMTVSQSETDAVVIQPTDPEVVYVPGYDTENVYVEQEGTTGDFLLNLFFTSGTVYFLDQIFNSDDDRYYYWGCVNSGGCNGRPIIGNPNNRPNIDGDMNLGIENSTSICWRPYDERNREARRAALDERRPAGKQTSKLPAQDEASRTDQRPEVDQPVKRNVHTARPQAVARGLPCAWRRGQPTYCDRPQCRWQIQSPDRSPRWTRYRSQMQLDIALQ